MGSFQWKIKTSLTDNLSVFSWTTGLGWCQVQIPTQQGTKSSVWLEGATMAVRLQAVLQIP